MTSKVAEAFSHRTRLVAQVYRVTGVWADAEDAVDEAFVRLAARDPSDGPDDPVGWLAVVATRVGIDCLRRRAREPYVGTWLPEPVDLDPLPDEVTERADELRMAVLVAYETLAPHERAALVLREGFGLPYEEIGDALGATAATARKWVSRARARLDGECRQSESPDPVQVARLVEAVTNGDVAAVTELLVDEVRLASDGGGRVNSVRRELVGPAKCAYFLVKSVERSGVEVAETRVNGEPALAVRSAGVVRVIQVYAEAGRISRLYFHCNPDKLHRVPLPAGWLTG